MTPRDKPNAAAVGWHRLGTAYRFESPWRRLREDRIRLDSGGEISYAYLEIPQAVYVVPLTDDGDIVLIRQYRYPVDDWCLEVPAGGVQDQGDASLEQVARIELAQEVGATCRLLEFIGGFYASNTHSDEQSHVYLARGVELGREQALEETEKIEIHCMPAAEAFRLARSGKIKDGPSALSLLLCEPHVLRRNVPG